MKITPKDFFLHLAATIALYTAVGSLINLLFTLINYYFPDNLAGYFYGNMVAWPISMLIVLVPILYVIEWMIKKDIRVMPEKGEIWVRRWRIYLTLFLTGVVLAGDLIALINTYLNGEITARFVYKFLVILVVLGIIFYYYLLERLNRRDNVKRILAYVGIVVVLAAIISGFITVGSPTKQRYLRFDSQRISDLQSAQWQIINYYQTKGKLPAKLDDVEDPIQGNIINDDPENNTRYEYNSSAPLKFQLCANFDLASEDTKGRGDYGYGKIGYPTYTDSYPYSGDENWKHQKGRTCFDRTIDPDKYPITPKPKPASVPAY